MRYCFLIVLFAIAHNSLATESNPSQRLDEKQVGLQDAIALALRNNLSLAIERINPERAEAGVLGARGNFDPTIRSNVRYGESSTPRLAEQQAADGRPSVQSRDTNANVSITQPTIMGTELSARFDTSNRQNTFNSFQDQYASNASLNLRHPLLKGSGVAANRANLDIAILGVRQANESFLNRIESVIADVHEAYFDLLFRIADYEAQEKNLLLAQQLLDDNQARLELGVMTPLDVSQARAEAASRMSDLIRANLSLEQAQNRLRALTSENLLAALRTPIHPAETMATPEPLPPGAEHVATGLANRRDLRAQFISAERDGLRIEFNRNQLLPQIDLVASYGLSGLSREFGESVERVGDARDDQWFVGIAVEIPLGNREPRSRLEDATLQRQQTLLRTKELEQQIILEVDNAAKEVESIQQQYETNKVARKFAEESAEAEAERLKAGVTTSFTVLQLQRDAALARTRELRSLADYHIALSKLRRAQGVLLQASGVYLN